MPFFGDNLLCNLSMSLIRITESVTSHRSVNIIVDGTIDQSSLPILQDVCTRHLKQHKSITVCLRGLVHIDGNGRGYLMRIKDEVELSHLPEFLKLELSGSKKNLGP